MSAPSDLQDVMPTILDVGRRLRFPSPSTAPASSRSCAATHPLWRDYLHGEHTACYEPDQGNQWVTDGHEKLIWYTHAGQEQFFDLDTDPREMHNAIDDADVSQRAAVWRQRLIDELTGRPEGYVQDGRLVAGQSELRPEQLQPATNRVSP